MQHDRRTILDGLVVGLIGYAAVALFYSVFDLLASRGPLYTVNLLGKAVFRGLRDPSVLMFAQDYDLSAIFAYNALHLAVALLIGLVATTVVGIAERTSSRAGLVRIVIVAGFIITVTIVGALTTPIRPLLPMWSVVATNALAAIIAGVYLLRRRPGLWHKLVLAS